MFFLTTTKACGPDAVHQLSAEICGNAPPPALNAFPMDLEEEIQMHLIFNASVT